MISKHCLNWLLLGLRNKHDTNIHLRSLQTKNSDNHHTMPTLRKESTMTQEALKLALEALELCNGAETVEGEECKYFWPITEEKNT